MVGPPLWSKGDVHLAGNPPWPTSCVAMGGDVSRQQSYQLAQGPPQLQWSPCSRPGPFPGQLASCDWRGVGGNNKGSDVLGQGGGSPAGRFSVDSPLALWGPHCSPTSPPAPTAFCHKYRPLVSTLHPQAVWASASKEPNWQQGSGSSRLWLEKGEEDIDLD